MAPLDEPQIEYALQTKYAGGDPDKALEILILFQESVEGLVRPYDHNVYMKGAENRENVTCYLDSLLFAMFARLGSFEPILYTTFEDEPRRRLSTLIRLWVNMLRTGKLIQTDIVSLTYTLLMLFADLKEDRTLAGGVSSMWLGRSRKYSTAGYFRGVRLHHRSATIASPHFGNGYFSRRERRCCR